MPRERSCSLGNSAAPSRQPRERAGLGTRLPVVCCGRAGFGGEVGARLQARFLPPSFSVSVTGVIPHPEPAQSQRRTLTLRGKVESFGNPRTAPRTRGETITHRRQSTQSFESEGNNWSSIAAISDPPFTAPLHVTCPLTKIFQGNHFQEIRGGEWPFLLHSFRRKPGAQLYRFTYKQGLSSLQRMRTDLQTTFKNYAPNYLVTLILIQTVNMQIRST